ncbi:hypothetical protein Q7C36_001374 [Tachysurus vachellii]|uniref:Uncharacterized protein n=1 Tax=Tachysurus vachellii TaxID=175792 RepID=A0AA88P3G4_TACVA|nr:hypothetical protein Q7C36_001374 [Tachysurus vachellii]
MTHNFKNKVKTVKKNAADEAPCSVSPKQLRLLNSCNWINGHNAEPRLLITPPETAVNTALPTSSLVFRLLQGHCTGSVPGQRHY